MRRLIAYAGIGALAAVLHDTRKNVTPRGVLMVERLLTDAASPLYGHRDPVQLRRAIVRTRAVLDGTE